MKLKFFTSLFLLLMVFGFTAFAQGNEKTISPEFALNLPIGAASNGVGIGFGFNAQAQFPVQKSNFSVLARSGLNLFTGKSYNYGYGTFSTGTSLDIPLLIGGRYYIADGFHSDLELGVLLGISGGTTTAFDFAPSVGYSVSGFDPFVRLSTSFSTGGSFFSFGARYQFRLK